MREDQDHMCQDGNRAILQIVSMLSLSLCHFMYALEKHPLRTP